MSHEGRNDRTIRLHGVCSKFGSSGTAYFLEKDVQNFIYILYRSYYGNYHVIKVLS